MSLSLSIPKITVIVPTLAEASRQYSLLKAIDSILLCDQYSVLPLIVVNGDRYCSSLLNTLNTMPDIKVIYREEGSLPGAIRAGRDRVESPFFCFLDDDDVYLPGGISVRVEAMLCDPTIDVVVSSGTRSDGSVFLRTHCQQDPLGAILESNWLTSCGGFYRSSTVGAEFFNPQIKFHEWTYLAYKLALNKNIKFIDDHTYHINDSQDSLSKSEAYMLAQLEVLKIMSQECPIEDFRKKLNMKYRKTSHCLSDYFRKKGRYKDAWYFHLKSLVSIDGIQYLPYTRKLIYLR